MQRGVSMKKIIALVLSCLLVFGFSYTAFAAETPETNAEAFVLYCVESGKIILSKNEEKRMKPASTTKLMTVLLTLEEAAKNDRVVTFTQEMTAEGSSMYLKTGEKVRLSDLAAGMMMCSGNDAANAAAVSISGSTERFSGLMNARARQLGMTRTHFVTPSGLDDDGHYTTAYDMALLMAAGLRSEAFANLTAQKSVTVKFEEPSDKKVTYSNHNRLLRMYDGCIGGKTGYTTAAGRCLVSAARRGGVTLICVTLNDKTDWADHMALYDSGFERLSCYSRNEADFCIDLPCAGGEKKSVPVVGEGCVSLVVEKCKSDKIERKVYLDPFVYAPVSAGEKLGRIEYLLDGKKLKSVPLLAVEDVKYKQIKKGLFQIIKEFFIYG